MKKGMDVSLQAQRDVLKAIKKLASEAMMKNMDEDEALVAELDMKRVPKEEAMEMVAEDMEDAGVDMEDAEVEMIDEDEDDLEALASMEDLAEDAEEDEEDKKKKRMKEMLGL